MLFEKSIEEEILGTKVHRFVKYVNLVVLTYPSVYRMYYGRNVLLDSDFIWIRMGDFHIPFIFVITGKTLRPKTRDLSFVH